MVVPFAPRGARIMLAVPGRALAGRRRIIISGDEARSCEPGLTVSYVYLVRAASLIPRARGDDDGMRGRPASAWCAPSVGSARLIVSQDVAEHEAVACHCFAAANRERCVETRSVPDKRMELPSLAARVNPGGKVGEQGLVVVASRELGR